MTEYGRWRSLIDGARAIPDSGIIRWTFDNNDLSGNDPLDVWNEYDGVNQGGVSTGASGANVNYSTNEAFSFDASSNSTVEVSNFSGFTSGTGSFALWIKVDGSIDGLNNPDGSILSIYESTSKVFDLALGNQANSGGYEFIVGGTSAVSNVGTTGEWIHIICVEDNGTHTIYINDTQEAQSSASQDLTILTNVMVGGDPSGKRIDALIDDFRVYDKALSSAERNNLYNTGAI